MLETLNIRNVAIIDSAEVPFKAGLNILSGETGAGKSIVLDSISLLLGSRANTDLIRAGADEAVIEGIFDIGELKWARERLAKLGFADAPEILIKRIIHRGGKHRIFVNGELATLNILQQLCEGLVDLCSQHEHQSLVKSATQLELVDRYGGLTELAAKFGEAFGAYQDLRAQIEELRRAESERNQRADFLKFQIEELRAAELSPGEDESLQKEKQLLQSAESRLGLAESARSMIEDERGALEALRGAVLKVRALEQVDGAVSDVGEALGRAVAEAEEAGLSLNRYLGAVDMDPERAQLVQDRLSLIAGFRRKYGTTVDEMLATLARLEAEYATIGGAEERLAALEAQVEELAGELRKLGKKLSASRRKVSETLAASVTGELQDLKMTGAQFLIEITAKDDLADWSASGADTIQFVVRTNAGEPAKPIGKIASGGELSRIMLAIRRVIADRGGIGVYLFDEIDAGMGGQTAFQVGKKLKSVAAYNQVICITHLPQVASFANHHLVVQKSTKAKRTTTEIVALDSAERKKELARMLGGPELTKKSLENAAELISAAAGARA